MQVSLSYDVETEHARLSTALARLDAQETLAAQAEAALALLDAIEHAEQALTRLLPQAESGETGFQVRVCGLRTLTFFAYDSLLRVYTAARTVLHDPESLPPPPTLLDTAFPAGTILSCPATSCGQGLYKVTVRATTAEIVLDEGLILCPLNTAIPPRSAWQVLSCVFCGRRVFRGGQLHTFQQGWQ